MRQNRHVHRDPEINLKFKDEGLNFMEHIELNNNEELRVLRGEEEEKNNRNYFDKIDIYMYLI